MSAVVVALVVCVLALSWWFRALMDRVQQHERAIEAIIEELVDRRRGQS